MRDGILFFKLIIFYPKKRSHRRQASDTTIEEKGGELFSIAIFACVPMAGQKERGLWLWSYAGQFLVDPCQIRSRSMSCQGGTDFAQLPSYLTLYHNKRFVNMAKLKIKFDILTLFPDVIYDYTSESILKRAQKAGLIKISAINFRDFTKDKQRHVDDRPYGGGAGMVLQIQPIYDCLKSIKALKQKNIKTSRAKLPNTNYKVLIMDPAGKKFDQRMAEKFSKLERIILICGRYEGFDERVYKLADEKISVGDFVLSGGELPALTIIEAVSRLIPGVLGNEESLDEESHGDNMRIRSEYPQYTRPDNFMGLKVPKVLLGGNHTKIAEWRKKRVK